MGQGQYIFCEWDSVVRSDRPNWIRTLYQNAVKTGEQKMIDKCTKEWAPKTCGGLTSRDGQFGGTTILPALFRGFSTAVMPHWRQNLTTGGHQTLIYGSQTGHTLVEDVKVLWTGLAFPNKQMAVSELKWQIGDRKYGCNDIEELRIYKKPVIIFEEAFTIDEEQAFDLYGHVEDPGYQRIVMLGECFYKYPDKFLGNCGATVV